MRLVLLALSGAVVVLLLLVQRLQSQVTAGCNAACVEAVRESLRRIDEENDMLRRELGRLRVELRMNPQLLEKPNANP